MKTCEILYNGKNKINLNNWKNFTIGKLFENVVKPPVLHTKDVTENVNGIPYVVRTKFDNGIKYNVEKKLQMQSSPAGTISFGAENATFFIREKSTYRVEIFIILILDI